MSAALSCDGCAAQWMIRSKRFSRNKCHHSVAVTNIKRLGSELPRGTLEPLEIPQCVPGGPKNTRRMLLSTPTILWP